MTQAKFKLIISDKARQMLAVHIRFLAQADKKASMKVCKLKRFFGSLLVVAFVSCMLTGCAGNSAGKVNEKEANASYVSEVFPLKRAGINLHLDCMKLEGTAPARNILLIHGVTYSSHEFDINYQD